MVPAFRSVLGVRPIEHEPGPAGQGLQVLRMVIDAVQECNLRCLYCHPGQVWVRQQLHADLVGSLLQAAEEYGCLEVILSGGEVTLHARLPQILAATRPLRRTAVTLITNGTMLTDRVLGELADSNVTRICVSVDGVDNDSHGSARGKNLHAVLAGLRAVQAAGRAVTVISVVHQRNYRRILELSQFLADSGLASQHHICAPSYSGTAREHFADLRLRYEDYFTLQDGVDRAHDELKYAGLFLTFNSFWPATGARSKVLDRGRVITLQQLSEQCKDTLVHVRPDGEFRLAAVSWGRETVGRADIGNVRQDPPKSLLAKADSAFRSDRLRQLPREVEARHKFQIGPGADKGATDALLAGTAGSESLIPVNRLPSLELFDNQLRATEIDATRRQMMADPAAFRVVRHASGVILVFNRKLSHVLLVQAAEWPTVRQALSAPDPALDWA